MIKKIILEKPVSWIKSETMGFCVGKLYENLFKILKSYNLNIEIIDIFYTGCGGPEYHRTPKFNYLDTLYISYHSYGLIVPNLLRIKENYLPGFFSIDPKGYSGFSEIADIDLNPKLDSIDFEIAKNFILNIINDIVKNNKSKYPQNNFNSNHNVLKNTIFFPLQVQDDSVLELTSFNFYDLLEYVCQNITFPIIIKIHPYANDIKNLKQKILDIIKINKNIILSDASVHQILPNCDCCMTINSGVGFEALLHNKPVITFGKSDYNTVTYNCYDKQQINDQLFYECLKNHDTVKTIKFLYYYLNTYCIYYDDFESLKNKIDNIIKTNNEL
jgi:hypothetical protein